MHPSIYFPFRQRWRQSGGFKQKHSVRVCSTYLYAECNRNNIFKGLASHLKYSFWIVSSGTGASELLVVLPPLVLRSLLLQNPGSRPITGRLSRDSAQLSGAEERIVAMVTRILSLAHSYICISWRSLVATPKTG